MWSHILNAMGDKIPRFNDYLLTQYREETINQIPQYLDKLFRQCMKTISSKFGVAAKVFKYLNYVELTPEERLSFLRDEVKYNRTFDIRTTNVKTMRYDFQFNDEVVSMFIDVPLVVNHAVTLHNVDYYPLFAVVEVGGMSLDKNRITLRVMRANLKFFKSDRQIQSIVTMDGRITNAMNYTCKLHLRSNNYPPTILYLFAKHGFSKTIEMLGYKDKIQLSSTYDATGKEHAYIRANDMVYIKVDNDVFTDEKAKRIVASLTVIYKVLRRFDLQSAMSGYYYRTVLGKLTFPSAPNNVLRESNAVEHLNMNESMLDEPSLENFRSIGLNISCIDDLILEMFNNLDEYLASSRLNDLYNKKLASLDKLTSELIERFNLKLFNQVINSKPGLTLNTVKNLMFCGGQNCKWMIGSQLFRSMPTIINDNALLTITSKRFRAFGDIEMSKNAVRNKMPIDHLKSHPSSIIIESIQAVPTSGISNGTINPYLVIDNDGTFIIDEELKQQVEHVFDT